MNTLSFCQRGIRLVGLPSFVLKWEMQPLTFMWTHNVSTVHFAGIRVDWPPLCCVHSCICRVTRSDVEPRKIVHSRMCESFQQGLWCCCWVWTLSNINRLNGSMMVTFLLYILRNLQSFTGGKFIEYSEALLILCYQETHRLGMCTLCWIGVQKCCDQKVSKELTVWTLLCLPCA